MITLEIPEAVPSLNTMLRRHWSVDRKLKTKWGKLVWVAVRSQRLTVQSPLQRARITITRLSPRMLDPDNATGGCKHILDSLRLLDIIADDTPEHVELIVRQEKGKAGTRIQIEALT
jgi:hypothetical protein